MKNILTLPSPNETIAWRRLRQPFAHYRDNVHSQNGEDGVIAELRGRLGIQHGWCCEFGAWDGKHLSNTYHLVEQGWRAVMIEGMPEKAEVLGRTARENDDRILPICSFVDPVAPGRTLDELLARTPIPNDFDVLSIDIDSWDYHIWRSLKNYSPKIVLIEIDSRLPVGVHSLHSPSNAKGGSSFSAMLELGQSKGYTLVAHTRTNLIFVRSDLAAMVRLPQVFLDHPELLFDAMCLPKSFPVRAVNKLHRVLHGLPYG